MSAINQEEIVACCSLKADTDAIMAESSAIWESVLTGFSSRTLKNTFPFRLRVGLVVGTSMGESKRKDLPKEPFNIYVDVPNWGDYSKGTHTIVWEREGTPSITIRRDSLHCALSYSANTDDETFWFR